MAKYRAQIRDLFLKPKALFITEGGTETTLFYRSDFPLREFCAFELLLTDDPRYKNWLYDDYAKFCENALKKGVNVSLDLVTWRMGRDWLEKLGYEDVEGTMKKIVRNGMDIINKLREKYERDGRIIVAGGEMGPRYDGYIAEKVMSVDESWKYHRESVKAHAEGGVDVLMCLTMTSGNESAGVAKAAAEMGIDVVISFTVELNGRLPSGESIPEAIDIVEKLGKWDGKSNVVFYMLNCAHWELVKNILEKAKKQGETWVDKIHGLRANSSRKSHEELEAMTTLDEGDPKEWGSGVASLRSEYGMRILGGCCGTSSIHQKHLVENLGT